MPGADAKSIRIIAHRGFSDIAPENTLAAFDRACHSAAEGIETDLHLTADKHIVLIHDPDLERTTPVCGQVAEMTLDEITEHDAGSWFHPIFADQRVPTLDQLFQRYGSRFHYDLELKADDLEPLVINCIRRFGLDKCVAVTSFDPARLIQIKGLMPTLPCGLLTSDFETDLIDQISRHGFELICPAVKIATPELIAAAREKRLGVWVWTLHNETDIKRLARLGVDAMIANDPDKVAACLNGRV